LKVVQAEQRAEAAEGRCCGLAVVERWTHHKASLEVEGVGERPHYPDWVAVAELVLDSEEAVVQMTSVHW
jgi:hypothetical protein